MGALVIHGIIMLIASTFYTPRAQTKRLKDAVSVEIFPSTKPPRPQVRAGRIPLLW